MKHAYILGIDEMRIAIAGHYNVSVDNVTIHAFRGKRGLRIEAWVSVGEEKIKDRMDYKEE